jgi:hypothetical protein
MLPQHLPAASPSGPGGWVPCGLDRHLGPFDPLHELSGWLGTDWFTCTACRCMVTRANARADRFAA